MDDAHKEDAVLLAVGELLGREVALDDLLRLIVDRVARSLQADRGTLYLVDPARGEVFSRAAHLPEIPEIRLKLGQGVAGHVAATGEVVNVGASDPPGRVFEPIDRRTGYKTRTLLAAPVRDHRGRIIGVLQLLNKRSGAFDAEDARILERLAAQAALALEATSLYQELRRAEVDPQAEVAYQYNHIIGETAAMRRAYHIVERAASSTATVLIRGESGTGKELFARAIHVNSPRQGGPFIKVDCAALPAGLIENELFGHEAGAFTGASRRAVGRFEAAHGGTLFIDELGELPLPVQGKLLRLLQDRAFERLGGRETVDVDVRIVAATNRDLEAMVEQGRFRADLYYRIRVVELRLPSLRERGPEDVRRLILHFGAAAARRHGRPHPTFDAAALARLVAYPWPGNVRELENCIESAVVLSDGGPIRDEDLPLPTRIPRLPPGGAPLWGEAEPWPQAPRERPLAPVPAQAQRETDEDRRLATVERRHLLRVLAEEGGNRSRAARVLGIGRNTLGRKLAEYGLTEGEVAEDAGG